MRKLVSLVIGACFFVNNVSFALSPPLLSGTFAEENHEHKFYIMAEVGLQDYLKSVDKFSNIADSRNEKFVKKAFSKHLRFSENEIYNAETTIFNPASITVCSKEVKQIGKNSPIFMVPVFVEKSGIREDYRLLFSTDKDGDNGYPSTLCTLEEFDTIENEVKTRKILPQRDAKSAKKLAGIKYQYLTQNDGIIDPFIEKRIKAKDFTEFEYRAEKVLQWNEDTFPGRRTPEKYLATNHSDYIKTELDKFLKIVDTNFDKTFKNKNIVLIRVPNGVSFPKIRQEPGGEDLEVTSHTSEHAVYTLLKEKDYDRLMAESNITDDVKNILKAIVDGMAHEAGVIYRLPWILAKTGHNNSWRFSNDLDLIYAQREIFSNDEITHNMNGQTNRKMILEILDTVKESIAKGPENLDHLIARGIHREYAAAKSCPFDPDDVNAIKQLIDDSSALSETTNEFIKQAEWEPKLGPETYRLLIESAKALPHKFNYNGAHIKTLAAIIKTPLNEAKIENNTLTIEKIDLDYIQCFFETLLKGCACRLTSTQYLADSLPKNWETWFNDPPKQADELLRVIITPNSQNEIPQKFFINVAAGGNINSDSKSIYMEAYSEKDRNRASETSKIKIDTSNINKGLPKLEKMIDSVLDKSAPEWIADYLTPKLNGIVNLQRLDTWALIFSEKITFDSGVGRLLPRLAKAGIKIAVIAKTPEHRTIIDYLNAVELENFENKILYFDDVMTVTTEIKGIQTFSYFKVEDEEEEYLPKNVVPVDEMTVRDIINALGKTCGFVGEDMEEIYTANEIFAKAV